MRNKFISLFYSVVKEEIIDDDTHLPCFNGRVVSWVSNFFVGIPIKPGQ